MAYTLTRDPLRIFTDLAFEWTQRRYLLIITAALRTSPSTLSLLWLGLYLLFYIVIGFAWTHVKLFIDVWQGALPPSLDQEVRAVYEGDKNYWTVALKLKWLVLQWLITWPLSVVYTILRHPFRILADFVYHLSQRKYAMIIERAMATRMKKQD